MNTFFLYSACALALLMCCPIFRAVFGPTVPDRLIGVNAIGTKTTILILFTGIIYRKADMFIDIALAYALLNFIAVLASAKYFHKRKGLDEE